MIKFNPSFVTMLAVAIHCWLAPSAYAAEGDVSEDGRACSATAFVQFLACRSDIVDDLYTLQALCINLSGGGERAECFSEARRDYIDALALCRVQQAARHGLCEGLGEDRHEPDFDPARFDADFTNPMSPNPYFPLAIGNKWSYAGPGETFTDEVLAKTKLIGGVTCLVVQNRAFEDGRLIELTDDWYARTLEGDIVYCGEQVQNFETFEGDNPAEPELVDLGGSFKAGNEALPGLLFPRFPMVGDVYRQEWAPGEAEDVAEVLSINYGFGSEPKLDAGVPREVAKMLCANDCIVTRENSPLEPAVSALKYYARGLGMIFEVERKSDGDLEVFQLVGCNFDARCDALPQPELEE